MFIDPLYTRYTSPSLSRLLQLDDIEIFFLHMAVDQMEPNRIRLLRWHSIHCCLRFGASVLNGVAQEEHQVVRKKTALSGDAFPPK